MTRNINKNIGIIKNILLHTFLIIIALVCLLPFFYSVFVSFGDNVAGTLMPESFSFSNYRILFSQHHFFKWMLISTGAGLGSAAISVLIISLAVYSYCRLNFYGNRQFFNFVMLVQIFPLTLVLVSIFKIFLAFELINSIFGLILIDSVIAAAGLFLIAISYFRMIPYELDEAAMIDGANRFTILLKIILPLAKPMFAVVAIQSFVLSYNEYAIAKTILIESIENVPVALGLQSIIYGQIQNWGVYCAGATIATIPILILFYCLQKYFVGELMEGGVKG